MVLICKLVGSSDRLVSGAVPNPPQMMLRVRDIEEIQVLVPRHAKHQTQP